MGIPPVRRVFELVVRPFRGTAAVDEEVAFHFAMQVEDLRRRGMSETEARAEAERRFGDKRRYRKGLIMIDRRRAFTPRHWIGGLRGFADGFGQDLRLAVRSLRRRPGFTALLVGMLTVGIGVVTAGFSIANWLVFRPAPGVRDADRVVRVSMADIMEFQGLTSSSPWTLSHEMLAAIGDRMADLGTLAGYTSSQLAIGAEGRTPRDAWGEFTSVNYPEVLGLTLSAGRWFTNEEDRDPRGTPIAVVSEALWRSVFGADARPTGQGMYVNGARVGVIGIVREYRGTSHGWKDPDLWMPSRARGVMTREPEKSGPFSLYDATNGFGAFYFRMKVGVTFAQVEARAQSATQLVTDRDPNRSQRFKATATVHRGPSFISLASIRSQLALLLGVCALVLIIAISNGANLLLMRGLSLRGETAMRRALGAGLARLTRQHLIATGLLAISGGAFGIAIAVGLLRFFEGASLASWTLRGISVDWRVLSFAAGTALLTAILTGLAPMNAARRADLLQTLRWTNRGSASSRAPFRKGLAGAQFAVASLLVVGALLFQRTLARFAAVEIGFDATDVAHLRLAPDRNGYTVARQLEYRNEFARRLAAIPGVRALAATNAAPYYVIRGGTVRPTPDTAGGVDLISAHVSAGYFELLRIRVTGREFRPTDSAQEVAIISTTVARKVFGETNPIGRTIFLHDGADMAKPTTVIGTVADGRALGPTDLVRPALYLPISNAEEAMSVLIRSPLSKGQLTAEIDQIAAAIDPTLPVGGLSMLEDDAREALRDRPLFARVLSLLALIGAVLAAVGLYGLISFAVVVRTRELGIRMALGAERRRVLRGVLSDGLVITGCGLAIGLGVAVAVTRFLKAWLFGVTPLDPASFAGAFGAIVIIGLAASLLPARAATRVDPAITLREE